MKIINDKVYWNVCKWQFSLIPINVGREVEWWVYDTIDRKADDIVDSKINGRVEGMFDFKIGGLL